MTLGSDDNAKSEHLS